MNAFRAERTERSHAFTLAMPMRDAVKLFEPEGERRWAEGWNPAYVFPTHGRAEAGMVFTTSHGNAEAVWTMVRHEPQAGLVEYVRVVPGSDIGRVLVQCSSLDAGRTRVNVIYVLTGLSDKGNSKVLAHAAHYEEYIDSWAAAIEKALK
jgi:hypothetical protein